MEYLQLLFHLTGDYLTQTDWMANSKTKSHWPAFCHALVYSLPFLFLTHSFLAISVILWTHFLIDRYRLARYVVFAKNWITDPSIRWVDCNVTGYSNQMAPWLGFILLTVADNCLHLLINFSAIRWL